MATTTGVCNFLADLSVKPKRSPILQTLAVSAEPATATTRWRRKKIERVDVEESQECRGKRKSRKDYSEEAKHMIRSEGSLEPRCSPLPLYIPEIDGVGLGLIMQYQRLGN
ncbi:hypothetical protein ACOSQ4_002047 [Xanthoceras sorbifolium]